MSSFALSENSRTLRMKPRDVLDHLGQLLRAEDEHGEDDERDQLEGSYVIEHLAAPRSPAAVRGSEAARARSTVPGHVAAVVGRRPEPAPRHPLDVIRRRSAEPSVSGTVRSSPARRSVSSSGRPGGGLRILTISSSPLWTAGPSTSVMTSPGLMPALSPGPPA